MKTTRERIRREKEEGARRFMEPKLIDTQWRFEQREYIQVGEIEAKIENLPSVYYYELLHPETNDKKYITSNAYYSYEISNQDYQESLYRMEMIDAWLFTKLEMTGEHTF